MKLFKSEIRRFARSGAVYCSLNSVSIFRLFLIQEKKVLTGKVLGLYTVYIDIYSKHSEHTVHST